jgi:polyphosphate kinase
MRKPSPNAKTQGKNRTTASGANSVRKAVSREVKLSDLTTSPELFFNREWSWLDFNSRVLALAASTSLPLLERVKFLSIVATNLDEFYMVRVAGLKEQVRNNVHEAGPDGVPPKEQLAGISRRVREMMALKARLWTRELMPQLAKSGVEIVEESELKQDDLKYLRKYFLRQVFPVLTPMGVDPAHPFPHLPNRSLSLCVALRNPGNGGTQKKSLYAFVEVPQLLPRFVPLRKAQGHSRLIPLCDVIAMHLSELFAGSDVIGSYPVRVTRDSELEIDEEDAVDLLKVVEAELRERKWGNVVRLEVSARTPEDVQRFLRQSLGIEREDVIPVDGPLNFGDFMALTRLKDCDSLRYRPYTPNLRPAWRQVRNIFDLIRTNDVLIHHPYESFAPVADFVEAAAIDPHVLAMKITLYRTSPESSILRSLMKAANNGKQVVALVELRARFDEANNIQWARALEHEGVHVVYGIVGLKTHCKACLVVRREDKQLRRYCHLATGNYNPTTAAMYTDIGLFTAEPSMCEDVANLFNMLTGFGNVADWNRIVLSPNAMHACLLKLIKREIEIARRGGKGRIICKMNSLVDPQMIAALYGASRAGVKVDLIVRGICCLRPGVPGVSENIRVVSIVGRFLEHSRIFYFGHKGDPLVYLSSADWMQRNFFSRVETMFPVEDIELRDRIVKDILTNALSDNVNAWELRSDGTWRRRTPSSPSSAYDSMAVLMRAEEKLLP